MRSSTKEQLVEAAEYAVRQASLYFQAAHLLESYIVSHSTTQGAVMAADNQVENTYTVAFTEMEFQDGEGWAVNFDMNGTGLVDIVVTESGDNPEVIASVYSLATVEGANQYVFTTDTYTAPSAQTVDVYIYPASTAVADITTSVALLPVQQAPSTEIGVSVSIAEPVNGNVDVTFTITDEWDGDRTYILAASNTPQTGGELELRDVFNVHNAPKGDTTRTVPADGKGLHIMVIGQSIDPLPPAWRGLSISQGQYAVLNDIAIPDAPGEAGFTYLAIAPDIPLGSFDSTDWAAAVAPLPLVFTAQTGFISTTTRDEENVFRMKLEPTSFGSEHIQMQAFLPSTRKGYETEFEILFESGFDFGRHQKAAKCGFGLGMQSFSELTNPKRTPGGHDNSQDGFSFRLMYNGTPSQPARFAPYYYGADRDPTYGTSGEYLFALDSDPIETNRRYKIRMQVIPNSSFSASDGVLRMYVDDNLHVESTGRKILSAGDLDAPWVFYEETFWGGNSIDYAGLTTSYINYFKPGYRELD